MPALTPYPYPWGSPGYWGYILLPSAVWRGLPTPSTFGRNQHVSPRLPTYCVLVWCVLRVLQCTSRRRHLVAQGVDAQPTRRRRRAPRTPKTGPRRGLRKTNPATHPKGPTPPPHTPGPTRWSSWSSSSPMVALAAPSPCLLATPPTPTSPLHHPFIFTPRCSTSACLLPSPPTFARRSAS